MSCHGSCGHERAHLSFEAIAQFLLCYIEIVVSLERQPELG